MWSRNTCNQYLLFPIIPEDKDEEIETVRKKFNMHSISIHAIYDIFFKYGQQVEKET